MIRIGEEPERRFAMPQQDLAHSMITRRACVVGAISFFSGSTVAHAAMQAAENPDADLSPGRTLDIRQFGAPMNGRQPDDPGIQRAINHLVSLTNPGGTIMVERGIVYTTGPIDLRPNVSLDFGRATVSLQPSGEYAIGIGWQETSPMVAMASVSGRWLGLWGNGKIAIAIRNGSGTQITNADIDLNSADQIGIRIHANDNPSGPYYGLVDNIRINGTGAAGQRGIVLEQERTNGSISVNRWIFSNLRHVASLEIGLDAQAVAGVVFNGINFESCHGSAARFGYANRTVRGSVTAEAGFNGVFRSAAIAASSVDLTGAVQILSGKNADETMIVSAIEAGTGRVIFPFAFPHKFQVGDQFVFTECKCNSISILNATYEGGSRPDEVAFEFLAGARDCRVELAFMTMAQGKYFTREIEDESNTIARRVQTITYTASLDAKPGVVWLPNALPGRGGATTQGTCWVDAIYVSGELGSGGSIEVQAFVDGIAQELTATLTPTSPFFARRIRKELHGGELIAAGRHVNVRVTKSDTRSAENLRVEVVLAYL